MGAKANKLGSCDKHMRKFVCSFTFVVHLFIFFSNTLCLPFCDYFRKKTLTF